MARVAFKHTLGRRPLTAAQTTASEMTLDGAQTVTGVKTFSAAPIISAGASFGVMPTIPVATVAALGTNQATAAPIVAGFTLVTGADDAVGVVLPAAVAGTICIIKVAPGADLKVYPASGDDINKIGANTAMVVVDDVCFMLVALNATDWYTVPLLPS